MKQLYFFLTVVLSMLMSLQARADEVLAGLGSELSAPAQLTEGTTVVFYCAGRGGYVKSIENHKVGLRTLETGTPASAAYLWTVCNVEPQADGVKFQLRANDGGLMTNFDGSRRVNTSPGNTAGTFTLTAGTSGGYWSIRDANGMYFNGDAVSGGGENFCGWNEAGGSSDYKIYLPEVKDVRLINTTFFCLDRVTMTPIRTADGDDLILSGRFLTGETVTFPTDDALRYYDLVQYEDGEGELHPASEPCVLPDDAEDEQDFILYYQPWPTVVIECVVGEGEDARVFYSKTVRVAKGDILPLPTKAEIGRGYNLLSTEYDNYVVRGDEVITLVYETVDTFPVKATTIVDGKLAPETQYYYINMDGHYLLATRSNPNLRIVDVDPTGKKTHMWAFVKGKADNSVIVYNRILGAAKAMTAAGTTNETQVTMAAPSARNNAEFELKDNGNGYTLVYTGTAHVCMTIYNHGTYIKMWNDAEGLTSSDCRMIFEPVVEETGIDDVTEGGASADDAVYDLSGRRVAHPGKGIYIRGGHKVVLP